MRERSVEKLQGVSKEMDESEWVWETEIGLETGVVGHRMGLREGLGRGPEWSDIGRMGQGGSGDMSRMGVACQIEAALKRWATA